MLYKYYLFFIFFNILFIGIPFNVSSQNQFGFRVTFKDKNTTSYSLTNPTAYLSSASLQRRVRQNINIDSTDLPVNKRYTDSVLGKTGGILHSSSKWFNNCVILLSDSSKISKLSGLSFISRIQLVLRTTSPIHSISFNNDTLSKTIPPFAKLYKTTGTKGYYGDTYEQMKVTNGDYLHDKGYRGKGITIAVLDEGFNMVDTLGGFDSLRKRNGIVDTYNFNTRLSNVFGYSNHGTMVLSTIAGILNNTFVGTAPDANIALYATEYGSTEQPFELDNLVAAMERADSIGTDIISISLGYNGFDLGSMPNPSFSYSDLDGKSTLVAKAANLATTKGILVVSSAGNEGSSTWKKILTPGDADSALTCGSVDINEILAPTSGRGPNASNITKPDVCMVGAPGFVLNNAGTTASVNGTSIATPQLSGLAACLWQAFPNATPYQLKNAIRMSASKSFSPDSNMGWGVPNFLKSYTFLEQYIDTILPSQTVVYPSPFVNNFFIRLESTFINKNIIWQLFNSQGLKLFEEIALGKAYHQFIQFSELPSGIYFFKLTTNDLSQILKIEKISK